jgi:hypothetical protein
VEVFVKEPDYSQQRKIGKQYKAIPLKLVRFKKTHHEINDGKLLYVNLYHKNPENSFYEKNYLLLKPVMVLIQKRFYLFRNVKWTF